jgi:hypothetical protein
LLPESFLDNYQYEELGKDNVLDEKFDLKKRKKNKTMLIKAQKNY